MNYWLKRGLVIAALGAGTILGGASIASADETGHDGGLLSVPVEVSDVAVDVLGTSDAVPAAVPAAANPGPSANGALVSIPVQVSEVDVDVLGTGGPDDQASSGAASAGERTLTSMSPAWTGTSTTGRAVVVVGTGSSLGSAFDDA